MEGVNWIQLREVNEGCCADLHVRQVLNLILDLQLCGYTCERREEIWRGFGWQLGATCTTLIGHLC